MDCEPSQTKHRARTSGSVLIFVLALVVLLSVMAMRLMKETISEMQHVSQFHRRDDLRIHAYSALEIAVGALAEWREIQRQLLSPAQGWGDPVKYAEIIKWTVRVAVENGKLPMEQLRKNRSLLASLFETMTMAEDDHVDYDESLEFADAFLDWEDADDNHRLDGAESSDYYENLEPPYFSPNRPIQSFDEFRLIKGFGPDPDDPEESGLFFDSQGTETANYQYFKNAVSLRSSHQLNVNEASGFLRRFLCGDNEYGVDEVDSFLRGEGNFGGPEDQPRYFQTPGDPRLIPLKGRGIPFGVDCKAFRVKVTVSRGKATFVLWALLEDASSPSAAPPSSALSTEANEARKRFEALKYPFKILALRENENFID